MKALTKKEMAKLDQEMIKLGIDVPRMMELAGLFVAVTATTLVKNKRKILVLSGTGNNGGDGLVAARHLINRGYKIDISFPTPTNNLKQIPLHQWNILRKMKVKAIKKLITRNMV